MRIARRVLRAALFVLGVLVVAWLVRAAGFDRVEEAIRQAGPWLPAIVALELAIVGCDVLATRHLLGEARARVTTATWVRSTAAAYGGAVVLPAGRAAGETARAAALSRDVGWPAAATAAAGVQAAVLFGNGFASLLAAIASIGASATLAALLGANALVVTVFGALVVTAARWKRLTRWLRARLSVPGAPGKPAAPRAIGRAAVFCIAERLIQTAEYAVALHAVGGVASLERALVAQGVHIVGATAGDFVPNQIGATEGAYRLFAGAIGLGDFPARALSIALLVRIAQLGLAAVAFVVAGLTRQRAEGEGKGESEVWR